MTDESASYSEEYTATRHIRTRGILENGLDQQGGFHIFIFLVPSEVKLP